MPLFIRLLLYIFSKFGRLVLWEIIFILELQFAETQVLIFSKLKSFSCACSHSHGIIKRIHFIKVTFIMPWYDTITIPYPSGRFPIQTFRKDTTLSHAVYPRIFCCTGLLSGTVRIGFHRFKFFTERWRAFYGPQYLFNHYTRDTGIGRA